tara:strand:- start:2305 stop:2457 length:153 start_codon:yes stop_codon:yes gene_type:complete
MQVHCKACGKDVTMETEFQNSPPFKIINNHKCEVKLARAKAKALEAGFIL